MKTKFGVFNLAVLMFMLAACGGGSGGGGSGGGGGGDEPDQQSIGGKVINLKYDINLLLIKNNRNWESLDVKSNGGDVNFSFIEAHDEGISFSIQVASYYGERKQNCLVTQGGGGTLSAANAKNTVLTCTDIDPVDPVGPVDPAPLVGRLLDSAVENISYSTETLSGRTNANGEFTYRENESITFSIGDFVFPTVNASPLITPLILANTNDLTSDKVINIVRLLISLDVDGNPENGITISDNAISYMTAFDFTLPIDEFAALPALPGLWPNAGLQQVRTELVSVEEASTHFYNTLEQNNILPSTACTETRVYNLDGQDIIAQPDGRLTNTNLHGTLTVLPNNSCSLEVNEGYQGDCQIIGTTVSALNGGLTGTISNKQVTLLNKAPLNSGNSENVSAFLTGVSDTSCSDEPITNGRYVISGSEAVTSPPPQGKRVIYPVTATLIISDDSCLVTSSEGSWSCTVSGNWFWGNDDTFVSGTITANSISYYLPILTDDGEYFYGQYSGQKTE